MSTLALIKGLGLLLGLLIAYLMSYPKQPEALTIERRKLNRDIVHILTGTKASQLNLSNTEELT
jgi:predicted histidine transporter YuiF (NhaC family)